MVLPVNIREFGNQLVITFNDGSKTVCYPTMGGLWLPNNTVNIGGAGNDSLQLVPVPPASGTGTAVDGTVYNFGQTQMLRAYQICAEAISIHGMDYNALVVGLITAIVESSIRNLSNITAYPASGSYPNIDGDGSDSDSVGIFQQRPSAGWGTTQECCTVTYETDAFYGGADGPNNGSPAGLFDLSPSWTTDATPGTSAQRVQVSAYPDRYDNVVPVAKSLLDVLIIAGSGASGTTKLSWPFSLNDVTSEYGSRINPVTGEVEALHDGMDFGENLGTPIHAVADGVCSSVPTGTGYGNVCYLQHSQFGGHTTTTFYGHQQYAPSVTVGQSVTYGQIIGYVDSTGLSTGDHLHFGTWDGDSYGQSINPRVFMSRYGGSTAESAGWE